MPHDSPDERGIKHWFTISSSPTDAPLISITTKFPTPNPSSSFKTALKNLKIGNSVSISDPMGDFVLPKDSRIPLVFVAGGIGITPFHSIIKWLIDTKQERDITFIYSVKNESEEVFQKLFEHYGMNRHLIIGEQLNGQQVLDIANPTSDALIYISGPEPMVEALQKGLESSGIEKSRLVGDFFPGYTIV